VGSLENAERQKTETRNRIRRQEIPLPPSSAFWILNSEC
jgi:hypothetical protein